MITNLLTLAYQVIAVGTACALCTLGMAVKAQWYEKRGNPGWATSIGMKIESVENTHILSSNLERVPPHVRQTVLSGDPSMTFVVSTVAAC